MKRYPAYRDSGVEWLGEVPEGWQVRPLKRDLTRNDGGVWGDDPDGENDAVVLRSTEQTEFGDWSIDDPAVRRIAPSEFLACRLAVGDLLVTKSSGSSKHIGKTTLVDQAVAELQACYSNFMQRLRCQPSVFPRLVWYFLNNRLARNQFDFLSSSTTGLANLSAGLIGQVIMPLGSLPEQTAIAAFLDVETAKIDGLVAEQWRLIDLLREKRQAVISHAVTRGLNPHAKLKPSGIDWLGDVPEGWKVKELKHLIADGTTITYGIVQAGPEFEGGIPYVRTGDMSGKALPISGYPLVSPEIEQGFIRSRVFPGDLVIAIRATIGKCLPVPDALPMANLTQGTAKISPGPSCLRDYLLFMLASDGAQTYFDLMAKGATFREITLDALRRLPVVLPSIEEQRLICAHLMDHAERFDTLTATAESAIALLQERRAALISAAVTGKIDVRGRVPQTGATTGAQPE